MQGAKYISASQSQQERKKATAAAVNCIWIYKYVSAGWAVFHVCGGEAGREFLVVHLEQYST